MTTVKLAARSRSVLKPMQFPIRMWGADFIRMGIMSNYQPGDYIKVEFKNDETGEGEWMWVRVESFDDESQIVFGQLDSVPVLDHGEKLKVGSKLAVSYSNIRQHKKASEFTEH
jgi:hypothetical protein